MVLTVIFFSFILPLILNSVLLIRFEARISGLIWSLAVLSYQVLMALVFDRSWFGPIVPGALLLLACAGALISWNRHRKMPWFGLPFPTFLTTILPLILIGFNAFDGFQYLKTTSLQKAPIELVFPLREGAYLISQGGAEEITNNHAIVPAEKYALDIVKVGPWGLRAHGILPRNLNNYLIYDQPVLAPCSGEVLATESMLSDREPPERSPFSIAGNYVILACEGVSILMAHFQQGSIKVKEGESVPTSAVLGRVGNTGNTTEPHLHVQAIAGRHAELSMFLSNGEAVPMVWKGRFLIRNNIVDSE